MTLTGLRLKLTFSLQDSSSRSPYTEVDITSLCAWPVVVESKGSPGEKRGKAVADPMVASAALLLLAPFSLPIRESGLVCLPITKRPLWVVGPAWPHWPYQ